MLFNFNINMMATMEVQIWRFVSTWYLQVLHRRASTTGIAT
jgi:hypothetical protein